MARTMQTQRRSSRRSSSSNLPRPVVPLRVGDWLDVMDTYGMWNVARVLSRPSPGEVEITYDGWPDEFDEVVHIDSHRVAPYHTFTYAVKCWVKYLNWPMWPAVITIRTPGTEEGIVNLRDEQRFHVDFFDHPDFEHRDRCWQKSQKGRLAAFNDKYEERRRRSNGNDFECSLARALKSDATTKMPVFSKGMLPVEYENATTQSVEEKRKSMGEELWHKNFLNSRERHCRTHAYDAIGGSLIQDEKKKVGATHDETSKVKIKPEQPLRATRKASRLKKERPGSPKASRSSTVLKENPSDDVEVPHNLSSGNSEEENAEEDAVAVQRKRPRLRTRRTTVPKGTNRITASVEVEKKSSDDVVEIPYALTDSSSEEESVDEDGGALKGRRRRLRTRRATVTKTTDRVMTSVEVEDKASHEVEAPCDPIDGSNGEEIVDENTLVVAEKRPRLRTRSAAALTATNPVMAPVEVEEKSSDDVEIPYELIGDSSKGEGGAEKTLAVKGKRRRLRTRQAAASFVDSEESKNEVMAPVELKEKSSNEVGISDQSNAASSGDESSTSGAPATKRKRPRLRTKSAVAPKSTKHRMPPVELEETDVEMPYELIEANSGDESSNGNAPKTQEKHHQQMKPSAAAASDELKGTESFSGGDGNSVAPAESNEIPESSHVDCSSEVANDKSTEPHRRLHRVMHDKRDTVTKVAFTRNANSSSKTVITVPRKFEQASCNDQEFSLKLTEHRIAPPPPLLSGKSRSNPRSGVALVSPSASVFSSSDRFSLDSWFRRKLYADFMAGGTQ